MCRRAWTWMWTITFRGRRSRVRRRRSPPSVTARRSHRSEESPRSNRKQRYVVLLYGRISGRQRETFAVGLGYQHPVEGISMKQRESAGGDGVIDCYGEGTETTVADELG